MSDAVTCFDCETPTSRDEIGVEKRVYDEEGHGTNGRPGKEGLVPICPDCRRADDD